MLKHSNQTSATWIWDYVLQ